MNGISLKPKDAVESTGLLDDVDVEVVGAAFEMWDYNGTQPQSVPALKLSMSVTDASGGQEVHDQYYSVGKPTDWAPTADGKQLQAIGTAVSLNSGSNGAILFKSLVEAGFPEDKIGDDVTVFVGTKGHVNRLPAPKRPGLKKREGDTREAMILCFTRIISLPGEAKAGGTNASSNTPPYHISTGSQPSVATSSIEETTTAILMGLLAEAGGKLTKASIPQKVFGKVKDRADKNAIVGKAFMDDFLSKGPWKYANGILSLE